MITVSATGDFDTAIALTKNYLEQVRWERRNAEEAIEIVNHASFLPLYEGFY